MDGLVLKSPLPIFELDLDLRSSIAPIDFLFEPDLNWHGGSKALDDCGPLLIGVYLSLIFWFTVSVIVYSSWILELYSTMFA